MYTYIYIYTYLVSVMWNEESTSVINRSLMCIHRSNNRRCNTLRHTATHKHDLPQHKQTCWSIKRRSTTGMSRRKRLLVCTHSTFSETSAFFFMYHAKRLKPTNNYWSADTNKGGEVGGWGRDPFSRNFMKPTPRRKWYLTTGRRFH